MYAPNTIDRQTNPTGLSYTFSRGVPISLTEFVSPFHSHEVLLPDLSLFVQDQWTVKRLTLNAGLRFDYLHTCVPAAQLEAGILTPARSFDKVDCVPCWKDLNTRVAVAYDLSGNGRTALKASLGRFTTASISA